jgi:hypothetical protein
MLIACLGWGSLVWDPRDLPVRGPWFADGPFLPIEFARQSRDGCITLVLAPGRPPVRSLWAMLAIGNLSDACAALAAREGIRASNVRRYVGVWTCNDRPATDGIVQTIEVWGRQRELDAVIWPALPPAFRHRRGYIPTAGEVVDYLSKLEGARRGRAEKYVRRAARQIDTDCRRYIAARLGWTPRDED